MRLAVFICLFMNILFATIVFYTYVVWSRYWTSVIHSRPTNYITAEYLQQLRRRRGQMPPHARRPPKTRAPYIFHPDERITHHRDVTVAQLRRVQLDWKMQKRENKYNVKFAGKRDQRASHRTAEELLCALKQAGVRTLGAEDEPFARIGLGKYFPTVAPLDGKAYNSCAVVASSGSLLNSALGEEIDSHDVVVRFNNAPTSEHSLDVGSKTTLRLLNSRVISEPQFDFLGSQMYKGVSLIAWDPSHYDGDQEKCSKYQDAECRATSSSLAEGQFGDTAPLRQWYRAPDFPVFTAYFQRRLMLPEEDFHLLEPGSLWRVWDFLQTHTYTSVLPNPPSSGFMGITMMLDRCSHVDVYEYVPSLRMTKRCHYYDAEQNEFCTLGAWHPLASEKLLALRMNYASDRDVFEKGVLRLKGFSQLNCS